MSEPRIMIAAGEVSGDLHGAALAAALHDVYPEAMLFGLAGPEMSEAGVRPLVDFNRLTVMGFVEIATSLPFFVRLRRRIGRLLDEKPPDLVIPINYPGFNLWLTREAHRRRIPVLFYIAPHLWAWRTDRARPLAEQADRVAVIFPQEESFLRRFGARAEFVGHPLAERAADWPDNRAALEALGLDPDRPVLGLLPGSRAQEVRRHLGPFLAAADRIRDRIPDVQVVLSKRPELPDELYADAPDVARTADSVTLMAAATAILTKAGTTTIEAALAGTPLVVAHRVHPLTFALARRLVHVDRIGMVNLLAGDRPVAPEYVQRLPPDEIAGSLLPLLDPTSDERQSMLEALRRVRARLGGPGASARVARIAKGLLDDSG